MIYFQLFSIFILFQSVRIRQKYCEGVQVIFRNETIHQLRENNNQHKLYWKYSYYAILKMMITLNYLIATQLY